MNLLLIISLTGSYELLIVGRFFVGLSSGLFAGLAPMYLGEIAPAHLRGAIGTIYQLVITITILLSFILGLPGALGTENLWPVLFGIIFVPSVAMIVALPFLPESPKHILIIKGKEVLSQQSLAWLRGTSEVHDEMEEMRSESEQMKMVPKVKLRDMWTNNLYRQPMIISVVIMMSQQMSGINLAMFFSIQIFESAGLSEEASLYASIGMGVINVLMTFVSLVLIERAGRRTLHLTGLAGMAFMTVLLTLSIVLKDSVPFFSWVSIIAVFLFVISFALGPGSIPWFLVQELFGIGARGLATSIAVSVNWSSNFVVGLIYLPLVEVLGGYTFLVFTILLIMFWIYTYKRVPETKGKSQEEIASIFRQQSYQG